MGKEGFSDNDIRDFSIRDVEPHERVQNIKSAEEEAGRADILKRDREAILSNEQNAIETLNHVYSNEVPSEYIALADSLIEKLTDLKKVIVIRYGNDSIPEEMWEADNTITKEDRDNLPKLINENDNKFLGVCAHGAWLADESEGKRAPNTWFGHGGASVINPSENKLGDKEFAYWLWKELLCSDSHDHINHCLRSIGFQLPRSDSDPTQTRKTW